MNSPDEQTPLPIGQLRALARRSLTGEAPKRNAANLEGVEKALVRRRQQVRRASLWSAAGAALAALVIVLGPRLFERALAFEVLRGSIAASGVIEGTEQGTELRFSDGTELDLTTHSRTRVAALSPHGAEIALERGKLQLRVIHRPAARWSVRAGAYQVNVTGTTFDVEFEPERRWLAVDLFQGSVSVSGPLISGGLTVSAGQRLMVLPGDSLVLVQRDVSTATAAAALGEPPAQPPAPVAKVQEEELPSAQPPVPRAPPPRANRSRGRAHRAVSAPPPSETWSQLVVAGRFNEVLRQAEQRELDRVYQEAVFDDLLALADAARYARRNAIARAALLALRERFAASTAAKEAAFFLGRLEEVGGAQRQALGWYEDYLGASPNGTYAAQALGKKLLLIDSDQGPDAARPIAEEYLRRFPMGPYAAAAAKLAAPGAAPLAAPSADELAAPR